MNRAAAKKRKRKQPQEPSENTKPKKCSKQRVKKQLEDEESDAELNVKHKPGDSSDKARTHVETITEPLHDFHLSQAARYIPVFGRKSGSIRNQKQAALDGADGEKREDERRMNTGTPVHTERPGSDNVVYAKMNKVDSDDAIDQVADVVFPLQEVEPTVAEPDRPADGRCLSVAYDTQDIVDNNDDADVINEHTELVREKPRLVLEKSERIQEKPKTIQDKLETVQEKSEMVQEKPEAVQEKPDVVQEKPEPVQEKQDMIQEKPKAVQLQPNMVQEKPKAVQEKPDMVQEKPEPVQKKPEPVQKKPEPVQEKPEPVQVEPEPVQEKPEQVQERPEPVQQKPNMVKEKPEPVIEKPEPVQMKPVPVQEKPEPVQEKPEPLQERPEPVQESPEPVQEKPEPVQEKPELVHEKPEPVQEKLEIVQEKFTQYVLELVQEKSKPTQPKQDGSGTDWNEEVVEKSEGLNVVSGDGRRLSVGGGSDPLEETWEAEPRGSLQEDRSTVDTFPVVSPTMSPSMSKAKLSPSVSTAMTSLDIVNSDAPLHVDSIKKETMADSIAVERVVTTELRGCVDDTSELTDSQLCQFIDDDMPVSSETCVPTRPDAETKHKRYRNASGSLGTTRSVNPLKNIDGTAEIQRVVRELNNINKMLLQQCRDIDQMKRQRLQRKRRPARPAGSRPAHTRGPKMGKPAAHKPAAH
ncbi:hypothetical protein LSAT2_025786 [Lamellibrachia satsuma]|nr:hypothetical protein LSAT2_025786 [Lamellibrachia satsuma]